MTIRRRSIGGLIGGLIIALAIPVVDLVVAIAWDRGIIAPDPDGPLIQALENTMVWGLALGPIGIVLAARSWGVSDRWSWAAVLLWSIPAIAVLWFAAAVWLGGLAGEPF